MTITPNTQAILLLTTRFKGTNGDGAKPLTPNEWGKFANWLKSQSLTPDCLLKTGLSNLLKSWKDTTISQDRLIRLLDRGTALALSTEKWQRSGLWVMTRTDADYPGRYKKRLGTDSPAVLFGCGERALLNRGGLAVVGSRNTDQCDLEYSRKIGSLAARSGYSIVSGAARGVDESAMLGALESEGKVVGVLANKLLSASSSSKYRNYLMKNNLALITPFNPEAGFNVGNAMQRNKYIYCLADASLVVRSGATGGTWNGATENFKKKWVRLWVKRINDPDSANGKLVQQGAEYINEDLTENEFKELFKPSERVGMENLDKFNNTSQQQMNLFKLKNQATSQKYNGKFFSLFIEEIQGYCNAPRSAADIAESLQLGKTQVNSWLKVAIEQGIIEKLTKPIRYQLIIAEQSRM